MEAITKDFLPAIALLVSIGSSIYAWLTGRAKEAHGRIDGLERRLNAAEQRISAIEGDIEHLPDKDATHRMEMAIARLEGRLEVMDERLKPVASIANRMNDILLERSS